MEKNHEITGKGRKKHSRQAKIDKVMAEFEAGTLKDSEGNVVTDRKQALAIAMEMANKEESNAKGSRVPRTEKEEAGPGIQGSKGQDY